MIELEFPDETVKQYKEGITGLEIASSISQKLAKEAGSNAVLCEGCH